MRNRIWRFLYPAIRMLALLCGILLYSGCEREQPVVHRQSFVFGTLVDLTVIGPEVEANLAIDDVFHDFDVWHHQLHPWKKPSQLVAINEHIAAGRSIHLSSLMADMIRDMSFYERKTQGFFNPAIGLLVDLWGFHADSFQAKCPDPQKVASLVRHHPSLADVRIDHNNVLFSHNRFVAIDDGGYAKGWVLDRAREILHRHHIQNALINIGGNVMALGANGNRPWWVGIRDPRSSHVFAIIPLKDGEAIGTSGDYHRYFEYHGIRYCHIINPFSGYPPRDVESVTILISDGENRGVRSDVLTKPLFLSPHDKWLGIAKSLGIRQAVRVEKGRYEMTRELSDRALFVDHKVVIVNVD